MVDAVLFSSRSNEWETPQDLFDRLNEEFHFTADAASTDENAKCEKHWTEKEDGLKQDWSHETVWCNPPYGRDIWKWCRKAYEESLRGATVVMLIPARTDTMHFHEFIVDKAEIRFLRGRIKFLHKGVELDRNPFPSMIVIWRGH